MHADRPHHPTPQPETVLPTWFRRCLIVVGALLMCSCRAIEPAAHGQGPLTGLPAPGVACDTCPLGGCEAPGCLACQPARLVGPSDEYLCDGGDSLSPVGVLFDASIAGLEQEDTVAHYNTRDGRVVVAPSSRVCIYAPRFGSVRRVVHPMGAEQRLFVDQMGDTFSLAEAERTVPPSTTLQNVSLRQQAGQLPPSLFRGRQQAGEGVYRVQAAETRGLVAPYSNLSLVSLGQITMGEAPLVADRTLAAITWTGDQEAQVALGAQGARALFSPKQPGLIYQTEEPNRPRLRLVKLASTDSAHPGDEVSFTLRFDNVGDAPIDGVVIVDNLTTRLAYVDESAKASVDAEFSATRNDAGSLVLRWEVAEPLRPGEGGVLTFRTKVR